MNLPNHLLFDKAFVESFRKLLKISVPGTVSLQLVETLKKLIEQQANVFETRDNILKQHGTLGDNGLPVFNSKDDELEFNTKIQELLGAEFDVPLKAKLKLDDSIKISGEEVICLKDILDIDL